MYSEMFSDIAKAVSKQSNAKIQQGCIAVVEPNCNVAAYAFSRCIDDKARKSCSGNCESCYLYADAFTLLLGKLREYGISESVHVDMYCDADKSTASKLASSALFADKTSESLDVRVSYNKDDKKQYSTSTSAQAKQIDSTAKNKKRSKPKPSVSKKVYTRKCVRCGRQFDTTRTVQKYCYKPSIAVCCECGKVFQYRCSSKAVPKTCGSKECIDSINNKIRAKAREVHQKNSQLKRKSEAHSDTSSV